MFAQIKNNNTFLLLTLIVIVGFLFRILGSYPGFNQFHSDEGITYSAAVSMIRNNNLDPLRYDYPALVPEVNYAFFKHIFIPIYVLKYYLVNIPQFLDGYASLIPSKVDYNRIFQNDILGNREVNALFWGRYTTAFVSTLSIILIYILGKQVFNKKVGIIAAFFLAVNFRSVTNSHIGLPDTYNAFFVLLSLIASYQLVIRRNTWSYLLAGIALGLSISTKYQVFIVFPLIYAHFISYFSIKPLREFKFKEIILAFLSVELFVAFFTAALVILSLNPYLLINNELAFTAIKDVSIKYAMGKKALSLFPLHYWIFIDHGASFILIILGLITMFIRSTKQFLFFASHLVPFLFVMLYYSNGGFYVRNFITITPLFLVCAAWFTVKIYNYLAHRSKVVATIVSLSLLVLAVYMPLKNSIIHTIEYRKPWNYETIVSSARKELFIGAAVVSHPFDPLPAELKINRIVINAATLYSLAEFRERSADFALINMDWAGDTFYSWMTAKAPETFSYILRKPYSEMRETFWGLTIEEMMQYVVVSEYKPWQAPEAGLFLVKVPRYENTKFKALADFSFEGSGLEWTITNESDASNDYLSYSTNLKSLKVGPGSSLFGNAFMSSPHFPVKPGSVYKVEGELFTQLFANSTPNVFLRIDFFNERNQKLSTSVSNRFSGTTGVVYAISQAPREASTARISLQSSVALSGEVFLKQVEVFESEVEPFNQENKVKFSDFKDLLYPNSHGNL